MHSQTLQLSEKQQWNQIGRKYNNRSFQHLKNQQIKVISNKTQYSQGDQNFHFFSPTRFTNEQIRNKLNKTLSLVRVIPYLFTRGPTF